MCNPTTPSSQLPPTLFWLLALGSSAWAQDGAEREQGLVVLDAQRVPAPGLKPLDLTGLHFFQRVGEGFYLGIGAYAPMLQGEYGGFMAVDATAHYQRPLHGRWFTQAGLALGGGGGGKSAEQSKVLSGSGGYAKAYAGLGYAFEGFTAGLNLSHFRFSHSLIRHSQPNLFVQVPFHYRALPYARAGMPLRPEEAVGEAGDSLLSFSLDNLHQIRPQASNTGTIRTVNVQYSRFWGPRHFGFVEAGLGWRGLPLYNHLMGGVGRREALAPGLNLYGQLGIGSGGYAPDTLDTGPGLLLYPKVGAEWMLSRDVGLMLSAGYLAAPRATSRNLSYGLTLNQHFKSLAGGASTPAHAQGVRMHLLSQTQFDLTVAGRERPSLPLLTVQVDMLAGRHLYLPLQLGVATGDYAGYPGYGEVLVGAGIQTAPTQTQPWQFFGQMLVGPNVHGLMLKPQIGLNHSLNERWAWSAQLGRSIGLGHYGQKSSRQTLRANAASVGVTYRFAVAKAK